MKSFVFKYGKDSNQAEIDQLIKSINLRGHYRSELVKSDNYLLIGCANNFIETENNSNYLYSDNHVVAVVSGEILGYENQIPWKKIISKVENYNYEWFKDLSGRFAIFIFLKHNKELCIITDNLGLLPVYYTIDKDEIRVSTSLPSFLVSNFRTDFNKNWLYEYLFFNITINESTFLSNVFRTNYSSVLRINTLNGSKSEVRYNEKLSVSNAIKSGKEGLAFSMDIINTEIPKYFNKSGMSVFALTSGLDTRTLLALVNEQVDVETFTYGTMFCGDILSSKRTVKSSRNKHNIVLFNDDFVEQLPSLINNAVKYSGGTLPAIRSSLFYVYSKLSLEYGKDTVLIGGIGGDRIRAQNTSDDSILTSGLKKFMHDGTFFIEGNLKGLFKDNGDFEAHIHKCFDWLNKVYGGVPSAERTLSISNYEVVPRYFLGEVNIVNNFFKYRLPFLDKKVFGISYQTDNGKLGFNYYSNARLKYKRNVLQSKVIYQNNKYKNVYLKGLPIKYFAKNNYLLYKIVRLIIRGKDVIINKNSKSTPLENWKEWFNVVLKDKIGLKINQNSRINKFLNYDKVSEIKNSDNVVLISKLLTAEMIIELIDNNWGLDKN